MFLDTSGLLAYHHRTEPQHRIAVSLFEAAAAKVTTNYVLAEFVALAEARRLPRVHALQFLRDLAINPVVEIIWVDAALHVEAMELLWDRRDKRWSLCDAVSFTVMLGRAMPDALTTDHHFEQGGVSGGCWNRRRARVYRYPVRRRISAAAARGPAGSATAALRHKSSAL